MKNSVPLLFLSSRLFTIFRVAVINTLTLLSLGSSMVVAGDQADANSCPATYTNPVIWEDLPDPEVIRVGDTYYYSASSFHHSPGAPLLRSYDLVHWEYIAHSVPLLDFHNTYDLNDGRSYVNGIWASSLQYRESNKTFYWMGCMHNKGGGYVFTATSPEGPWAKAASQSCYYDMGLLIDKDTDKMYVAWGNDQINVAELSSDGLREIRRKEVFKTPSSISGPLEGSRFYKINGNYYIFMTQYANGEYVARSTTGPFGPYEIRPFAVLPVLLPAVRHTRAALFKRSAAIGITWHLTMLTPRGVYP
jgi:beta-xylosidase